MVRVKSRNKIKQNTSGQIFDFTVVIILALVVCITLYPVLYIFSLSISSVTAIEKREVWLFPVGFNIDSYKLLVQHKELPRSFLNSIVYTTLGTAYDMVLTVCAAYALSRRWLKGKSFLMLLLSFVMWFSGGLIPTYLQLSNMHLLNTMAVMIIPGAVSVYNLIVMKTTMQEIPESIEESAKLDGANDITIMAKIIVPMSIPVVATIALFYIVGHWNAWFNAMIYLNNRKLFPLQLIVRELVVVMTDQSMNQHADDFNTTPLAFRSAVMVITILPLLIVYPFIQKYFVKGIMLGSVKS